MWTLSASIQAPRVCAHMQQSAVQSCSWPQELLWAGHIPPAQHCSAREAVHGVAAQLQHDCQNCAGIVSPLSSGEQKKLWQGMKMFIQ